MDQEEAFPGDGWRGDARPAPGAPDGPDSGQDDDWDQEAALDALVARAEAGLLLDILADELDVPVGESDIPADKVEWPEPGRRRRAAGEAGESFAAGFLPRDPPTAVLSAGAAGLFASGGPLDAAPPDLAVAEFAEEVTGPDGRCPGTTDDELIGVLRSWQRQESRAAARKLAVVAELIRRRPAPRCAPARPGGMPTAWDKFCGDELAAATATSGQAAEKTLTLAHDLATRLRRTAQALHDGVIDVYKARIIADATRVLDDAEAAAAETLVLSGIAQKTPGQVRAAIARAVITVNPEAARDRREQAQRDARVELWREDAGTAALCGYGLPPDKALAADQMISARARELRACGLDGNMDQLRVRAYLDFLLGQDSRPRRDDARSQADTGRGRQPAEHGQPDQDSGHRSAAPGTNDSGGQSSDGHSSGGQSGGGQSGGGQSGGGQSGGGQSGGGQSGGGQSGGQHSGGRHSSGGQSSAAQSSGGQSGGGQSGGPSSGGSDHLGPAGVSPAAAPDRDGPFGATLAARINLTVPLATLLGLAERPGEVHGLGAIDPALARTLTNAAAANPATTWCVTVTDRDGHPTAHGCARPARAKDAMPGSGTGNRDGPGYNFQPGNGGPPGNGGATEIDGHGRWRLRTPGLAGRDYIIDIGPLAVTDCDHRHESAGYQPSDRLRHLVEIRDGQCTWPPCRRTARGCDFEHAVPYDQGGRTCACNAGPRCRHHHHAKQAAGWRLDQHLPGYHTWTTPSGRSYTTGPTQYPI